MYENRATYTWWDIEDGVGSLATQAVGRWEALGLPKDAIEAPVVLRVWVTADDDIVYTLTLTRAHSDVYTAEGFIPLIMDGPRSTRLRGAEAKIWESAAELAGEGIADQLTEGLRTWLHQK